MVKTGGRVFRWRLDMVSTVVWISFLSLWGSGSDDRVRWAKDVYIRDHLRVKCGRKLHMLVTIARQCVVALLRCYVSQLLHRDKDEG